MHHFVSGILTLKRQEVENVAQDTNQKVVKNDKKDLASNKPAKPIAHDELT